MALLNLGIQKLVCQLLQLALLPSERVVASLLRVAGGGALAVLAGNGERRALVLVASALEERNLRDVSYLAGILVLIEFQVLKVFLKRVPNNNFVVEDFFENWCDFGIGGRMLEIACLDARDPLSVIDDLGPGLD